jgi:hypothetical protein
MNSMFPLAVRLGAVCAGVLLTVAPTTKGAQVAGDALFSSPALPEFKIEIAPSDLDRLQRAHGPYVPATVTVGETPFLKVGVRLKGQGSFRPVRDRPSLALKFDEFMPRQHLSGLTKIFLNNSSQDATLLSEYVATGLFRQVGVPAARVTHARVELNGRDLGFYVLIEAMNKTFLRQHFRKDSGNLYEGYAKDIDQKLEQDSGKPGDQSDVRELVAAARAPVSERMARLQAVLDVDHFLSFLAISMLSAQHDSYPLNRNNYRLYHDPASDRFSMIAHGIDGSFSRNSTSLMPPLKYILTRGVLEPTAGRQLYRERVGTLFTNLFTRELFTNRIQTALIRLQGAAHSQTERTNLVAQADSFLHRIGQRIDNVARQLTEPELTRLAFNADGSAPLDGWEPHADSGSPRLDQTELEGIRALHIRNGPSSTAGTWRKRVWLGPGDYRLVARARVAGIQTNWANPVGAAVRLSGRGVVRRLSTNGVWTDLDTSFSVRESEDEVELVCELRAPSGEAWFDRGSLKLIRGAPQREREDSTRETEQRP